MKCSKCAREAVLFQQYSGRHLCPDHLAADIEARIKRDIRAGGWMRHGDHLAVAFSGSRISRAMLSFFHNLTTQRRDIRLSAIVIDEGIAGCRDYGDAVGFAARLGIPVHSSSFRDKFRYTADDLARKGGPGSACTRCRRLREDLINAIARTEGVTRIFSARTLEDRAVRILEPVLRGNAESLFGTAEGSRGIPWADPLGSVPEKELDLYADLVCPGPVATDCPHRVVGFSGEIRSLLDDYTERHPATPYSISVIGEAIRTCSCTSRNGTEVKIRAP